MLFQYHNLRHTLPYRLITPYVRTCRERLYRVPYLQITARLTRMKPEDADNDDAKALGEDTPLMKEVSGKPARRLL